VFKIPPHLQRFAIDQVANSARPVLFTIFSLDMLQLKGGCGYSVHFCSLRDQIYTHTLYTWASIIGWTGGQVPPPLFEVGGVMCFVPPTFWGNKFTIFLLNTARIPIWKFFMVPICESDNYS